MPASGFQEQLDQALQFIRLHGYCRQSDEKIEELLGRMQAEPEKRSDYDSLIQKSFDTNINAPELLLLLSLMTDPEQSRSAVAELLNGRLFSKLSNGDIRFLTSHFFGGHSPLPYQIVNEITNRSFLTYQRAILEALKISEVESPFSPEEILLFLTQLLCRMNMNAENRAMIYVLLSRMDVDLPPGIDAAVRAAMVDLSEILSEVEERKESVLADSFVARQNTSMSKDTYDWSPPAAQQTQPQPPSRGVAPAAAAQGQTGSAQHFEYPSPAPAAKNPGQTPTRQAAPGVAAAPEAAAPGLYAGLAESKPGTASAASKTEGRPTSSQAQSSGTSAPNAPWDSASAFAPRGTEPSAKTPDAAPHQTQQREEQESIFATNGPSGPGHKSHEKKDSRRFTIRFTRESAELGKVIRALEESAERKAREEAELKGIKLEEASESEVRHEIQESLQILDQLKHPKPTRKLPWLAIALGAGALIVLVIVLALTLGRGGPAVTVTPPPLDSNPPLVQTPRYLSEGVFKIAIEGKNAVWYPTRGQTLWQLFEFVEGKTGPAELKSLTGKGWDAYVKTIFRHNATITDANRIEESQGIVLLELP